jgi:hypothetical protein
MSGGGGGIIIIRSAMKQALSDPLVHGILTEKQKSLIDPILLEDVNNWTPQDDENVRKVFDWVARNC